MTVHAPFRFAPIHRWVYLPEWGDLVSHDVPFADGLSGEIALEIEAHTPLLVGGVRQAATRPRPASEFEQAVPARAGEVWPFTVIDRDGRETLAIPGSSLQGLARSVLEIAAFGRLGTWVDEKRFGVRDLTAAATPYYQSRLLDSQYVRDRGIVIVKPRVRAGWLKRERVSEGGSNARSYRYMLTECAYARVEYIDVAALTGITLQELTKKSDADTRYAAACRPTGAPDPGTRPLSMKLWVEDQAMPHPHGATKKVPLEIFYRKSGIDRARLLGSSTQRNGTLVLTGNPSDPQLESNKHMEFLFLDDPVGTGKAVSFSVDAAVVDAFLAIHEPEDGRDANPNWAFYRDHGHPAKAPFLENGEMPVFFILDARGQIASFGLAFMFKLAHALTTTELLLNSTADHAEGGRTDLPSLIFGSVAGDDGTGLKRRAFFDDALALSKPAPAASFSRQAVLLSPKPAYAPLYVRQPDAATAERLPTAETKNGKDYPAPYATYTPIERAKGLRPEHRHPELAGVKIWPARGSIANRWRSEHVAGDLQLQTTLNAVGAGAKFRTTLRVHNLRPTELGALLWALSFGDAAAWSGGNVAPALRHRLGMGKPYGLGEIAIRILQTNLVSNDSAAPPSTEQLVSAFELEMRRAYRVPAAVRAEKPHEWGDSVQIRTLREAANPRVGAERNLRVSKTRRSEAQQFDYMELNPKKPGGFNDFLVERSAAAFLPRYAKGYELQRDTRATGSATEGGSPATAGPSVRGGPGGAATQIRGDAPRVPVRDPFAVGRQVRHKNDIGVVVRAMDAMGFIVVSFGDEHEPRRKDELKPVD